MASDKTARLLKQVRRSTSQIPHMVTPVASDMILPNHSGVKRDPNKSGEIATKKYVDDNAGGAPEGTAVKSTGEGGGTKYLREDGDGTCSWQTPAGSGDVTAAVNLTDETLVQGDGGVKGVKTSTVTAANVIANNAKVSNATHSGDATGATALTLATVNSNVGSFTAADITVNAKGLITAAANGSGGAPEGTAVLSTGEGGGTKYLREDGDGTCSWQTPAGSGDVSKVGTPVNNQVGVWTGDGTLEGDADYTWDGSQATINGNFLVEDATIATKAYRFRTNGGALDCEAGGAGWVISNWSNASFSGTQYFYMYMDSGSHAMNTHGNWYFRDGNSYATSGNKVFCIDVNGTEVVVNEDGSTYDFRCEGDTNTHLLFVDSTNDKVGVGTSAPDTILHVAGAITARELSADPSDPDEGENVTWQSDGTGSGDDGDIMIKITAGGVTKTTTLVDFSAL